MCGIAGYIDFNKTTPAETIGKMVQVLNHRGPDDSGAELYNTKNADIGLGQARLSIIDLSYAGHQPMHYKNLSIVFNGEIYNYKEIKINLIELGHVFISNSDTEVILHSCEKPSYFLVTFASTSVTEKPLTSFSSLIFLILPEFNFSTIIPW